MNIRFYLILIISAFTKFLPLPAKSGLLRIGNPTKESPVLVTSNYVQTVALVKKALSGLNAFLLIAPTKGINVWCAATGGHFTTHSVVSVLKTSGINDLVVHRRIILPQLAATGVELHVLKEKTGWDGIWGPVYATDIPAFLNNKYQKSVDMREVKFPLFQRLEMAIAWAFPISIFFTLLLAFTWESLVLPAIILTWGISILLLLIFPIYHRLILQQSRLIQSQFWIFKHTILQLIIWLGAICSLLLFFQYVDYFSPNEQITLMGLALLLIIILHIDFLGNSPIYKSTLHDEGFEITLDSDLCEVAKDCLDVCPRSCFNYDEENKIIQLSRIESCVQCGACIVQCPYDALSMQNLSGEIITPMTIRKYKLNMMGKRKITQIPE
ncbi:MAG: HgcAB-like fusion protein [Candidatus Kariarchaeaceae archaeon]|jgi:NAD-dependent dihydropyrimidine dehydrogenase PreA subunit